MFIVGNRLEMKQFKDTSVTITRFIFIEDKYDFFVRLRRIIRKRYMASDVKVELEHNVIDGLSKEELYILQYDSGEEAKRLTQI